METVILHWFIIHIVLYTVTIQ